MVSPEVFSFVHFERQLAYLDAVRCHKLQVEEANHTWLCLDLLDMLYQLVERGHVKSIRSMIEFPLKHYTKTYSLGSLMSMYLQDSLFKQRLIDAFLYFLLYCSLFAFSL